jgi:hypothetical protein
MMVGDIRFIASLELLDFSYAAFADSICLRGSGLSDTSKWPSPGISL